MDTKKRGSWTIKEAASLLGVSEKTVRRRIRAGTVEAREVRGKRGVEWRVTGIPRATPDGSTDVSTIIFSDLLREKDNRIEELNRMVGAAQMRINQLENENRLLKAPDTTVVKRPWWRRWWGR